MTLNSPFHHEALPRAIETVRHSTGTTSGRENTVFIKKTTSAKDDLSGKVVGGIARSVINSHVAKRSHEKRGRLQWKPAETIPNVIVLQHHR